MDKSTSFISWHDISVWMYGVMLFVLYWVCKFIWWFIPREHIKYRENFKEDIFEGMESRMEKRMEIGKNELKKEITDGDDRLMEKVNELSERITIYKQEKHDIVNEHAGLVGTTQICSEALDKAALIIKKYEEKKHN